MLEQIFSSRLIYLTQFDDDEFLRTFKIVTIEVGRGLKKDIICFVEGVGERIKSEFPSRN